MAGYPVAEAIGKYKIMLTHMVDCCINLHINPAKLIFSELISGCLHDEWR
jgi:hypothetical protein